MGEWHWNPQVDQLIDHIPFSDDEITELMKLAPDCFDDPYNFPVWFMEIQYRLSDNLMKKIIGFRKDHELDEFGWHLS